MIAAIGITLALGLIFALSAIYVPLKNQVIGLSLIVIGTVFITASVILSIAYRVNKHENPQPKPIQTQALEKGDSK